MKRITTWEVAREIGWMWLLIPTPSVVGAVASAIYPDGTFPIGVLAGIGTVHVLLTAFVGAYTEILRRHGNPTPEREGLFGWITAASAERGRRWSADTRVRDLALAIRMHRDKVNDTDVPVYLGHTPDSEVPS